MSPRWEKTTPVRLIFESGAWKLELEELVPITRTIFRPVFYLVEGAETILSCLRIIEGPPELLQEAERIVQLPVGQPDEAVTYDARKNAWVLSAPDLDPPAVGQEGSRTPAEERFEMRLRSVERAMSRLAHVEQRLVRVERLEKRVAIIENQDRISLQSQRAQLERQPDPGQAAQPVGAPEHAGQAAQPVGVPEHAQSDDQPVRDERPPAVQQRPALDAAASGGAPEPDSPEAKDASQAAPASAPGAEARKATFSWPSKKAVEQALNMLVGIKMNLKAIPAADHTVFGEDGTDWYAAKLIGDDDEVLGVLLADLSATIHLGGGLMMVPEAVRQEEIQRGQPSEEEIDAMSEIFNNLGALINKVRENPHVRATPAAAVDPAVRAKVGSSSERLELEASFGGRLIMISN